MSGKESFHTEFAKNLDKENVPIADSSRQSKKSPKEVIESTKPFDVEHAFIKFPGEETQPLTAKTQSADQVTVSFSEIGKRGGFDKEHNFIHTHPSIVPASIVSSLGRAGIDKAKAEKMSSAGVLHSADDLRMFLYMPTAKSSTIVFRDLNSGEVLGYNVLQKTGKTPPSPFADIDSRVKFYWRVVQFKLGLGKIFKDAKKHKASVIPAIKQEDFSILRQSYDKFLELYGLRSRLVPAAGYEVNEWRTGFKKKSEDS